MQCDLLEAQACADWTSSRTGGDQFAKKSPARCGAFLFQRPRTRAAGVSIDPLGSAVTAMGPSVFPEMLMGLVAIRPVWPTVTPVVRYSVPGWQTVTPVVRYSVPGRFIGAWAKANVAGSVKASASAIVVSFMGSPCV